ncbi:MAG TPA: hypothetical protein VMB50_12615 [Myxococcales bacterium]|nr:hypothetical protein [Myxococcales bacterium]
MRRLALSLCLFFSAGALAQASSEDQQWLAQMNALMKDQTPKGARQRATLAYWALTTYTGRAERLGIDPNAVKSQGIKDILAAAGGMPDSPGIWREVEAWDRLGGFDALGGARVVCPVADRAPANAEAGELCGDLRKESGDLVGAVRAWRRAIDGNGARADKVRVIMKIDGASPAPERDLAGVSPALVQEARYAEQQQGQAAQAQQVSAAVQACDNSCNLQASNCHAAVGYGVFDNCENQRTSCYSSCAYSNGASAPPVTPYVPPVYAPYPVYPY